MSGKVFISMADKYKADAVGIAKQLTDMGYGVVATRGTASTLMAAGGWGCSRGRCGCVLWVFVVGCVCFGGWGACQWCGCVRMNPADQPWEQLAQGCWLLPP